MSDVQQQDYEGPVLSGPAPEPDETNSSALVPMSLAATLTKAEIDQQIATAHAFPRSPARARDMMVSLATMDQRMAEECIYAVPRGGKTIRGESIRFAEIVIGAWGNVRCAARVTHEDRIDRYVEAEAVVHDLETNMGWVSRVRRRIELKKGRKTVDADMVQLAGGAAMSIARRNAILAAVPKPVWARASDAVKSVIRGDQKTLVERRDAAIATFAKAGVTVERVLKALEVAHVDDITLDHLLDMSAMKTAIYSGEATVDQLFPEERAPGPKVETLDDQLKAVANIDPKTGAAKKSDAPAPLTSGGAEAGPPLSTTASASGEAKGQRGPKSARKPSELDRLAAEGDAAAAKGWEAYSEWLNGLAPAEITLLTVAQRAAWAANAKKVAA
jgi:hypothetical protein